MGKKAKPKPSPAATSASSSSSSSAAQAKADHTSQGKSKSKRSTHSRGTDDDSQYAAFSSQLSSLSLRVQSITGDGNCLFRSIADQVDGDQNRHLHYRTLACQHIRANPAEYAPFIDGDDERSRQAALSSYVDRMSRLGEWGGNLELVAISRAMGRDVVVHQLTAPRLVIQGGSEGQAIHLAYHSEEHYSSVRGKDDHSVNQPPLPILLDLRPPSSSSSSSSSSSMKKSSVNPVERMVMERSGCGDVHKVRQCLRDLDGDSESAVEVLKAEKEMEENERKEKGAAEELAAQKAREQKERDEGEVKRAEEAKEEAKRVNAAQGAKEKRLALKNEREAKKLERVKERKMERVRAKEAEQVMKAQEGAAGEQKRGDNDQDAVTQDFGSLTI